MNLNIFVSKTCFIYCKGCYSYSREEKFSSLLPSNKIIDFLQYAYQNGIERVTLCGGDPLARVDIIELLKAIKSIGYTISLDTIGTPLIRDVKVGNNIIIPKIDVKSIAKLVDFWGIPIDGSTSDIIRFFRPTRSDILNDQLSICNILNKHDAKICINTVVHKENIYDAKNLARLIKSIDGINKWQMFQFAPLGKFGYLNKHLFEITESQFNEFKKNVEQEFKDIKKLEFKGSKNRVKKYMLIDNSGNTWVPEFEKIITSDFNQEKIKRLVIGNITNKSDWEKICTYIKNSK